jgi:glycosyltransferase involved in cell wall biosynthesis
MKIKYYRNFDLDRRPSMNQYADQLLNYQSKIFTDYEISSFKPSEDYISKIIFSQKWKARYLRYISYSRQIKKLPKHDIAHVCDQQYAQIVNSLNSKIKFITVHDLVPLVFQNILKKKPYLSIHSLKYLKYYTKVFTISENTKKDIIKYTDCHEDQIIVIMRSVENFFNDSDIDKENICRKYNLPFNKKKILIAGNIFYKNIQTSLEVLKKLNQQRNDVIFIQIGSNNEISGEKIHNKNLYKIPFIKRDELPSIYKISNLLFYPSKYEGFGMPLLEAMSCGLPVVCSNNSSIPEVVGDAGLMSDCKDIDRFIKNIYSIIDDEIFSNQLKIKSLTRSKNFNNNNFHKRLISHYENELNRAT